LFHFDGSLSAVSGELPLRAEGVHFVSGRWGSAVAVPKGGTLRYRMRGNLDWRSGTIEMWISPQMPGRDPDYSRRNHALLLYHTPKAEQFLVATTSSGGFYAGIYTGKAFFGPGGGEIASWRQGEWHHVAFTYSAREGRSRFYVDGERVSEARWSPPAIDMSGDAFTVGCDPYGAASSFAVDELRISPDELSPETVLCDAARSVPFRPGEIQRLALGSF
jgi:hypothetical protein